MNPSHLVRDLGFVEVCADMYASSLPEGPPKGFRGVEWFHEKWMILALVFILPKYYQGLIHSVCSHRWTQRGWKCSSDVSECLWKWGIVVHEMHASCEASDLLTSLLVSLQPAFLYRSQSLFVCFCIVLQTSSLSVCLSVKVCIPLWGITCLTRI